MIKTRIIPTLLYRNPTLVKGISFDSWRRVGSVIQSVKIFNMREVDELIFLDITATNEKREPDYRLIDEIADECFMPLTVGGGIKNITEIKELLNVGADKVSINTAAVENPKLIDEAANKYGSQCIVVSIDFRKETDGSFRVFTNAGRTRTNYNPFEISKIAEENGAGEILLTSIDRDGTFSGYELDVIKKISSDARIPVIASGGAGKPEHILDVIKTANVSAAAAASIYFFTEITPKDVKTYLNENNIPTRK